MWAADLVDSQLYAYDFDTKARDSSKDFDSLDSSNTQPSGITSDGTTMWVVDNASQEKIFAYKLSDQSRDSAKDITYHSDARVLWGLWTNGTTIWALNFPNSGDDELHAYEASTGNRDSSKDITLHSDNADGSSL